MTRPPGIGWRRALATLRTEKRRRRSTPPCPGTQLPPCPTRRFHHPPTHPRVHASSTLATFSLFFGRQRPSPPLPRNHTLTATPPRTPTRPPQRLCVSSSLHGQQPKPPPLNVGRPSSSSKQQASKQPQSASTHTQQQNMKRLTTLLLLLLVPATPASAFVFPSSSSPPTPALPATERLSTTRLYSSTLSRPPRSRTLIASPPPTPPPLPSPLPLTAPQRRRQRDDEEEDDLDYVEVEEEEEEEEEETEEEEKPLKRLNKTPSGGATDHPDHLQARVITTTARYSLLVAGAGTGKTRVLAARAAHLVRPPFHPPTHLPTHPILSAARLVRFSSHPPTHLPTQTGKDRTSPTRGDLGPLLHERSRSFHPIKSECPPRSNEQPQAAAQGGGGRGRGRGGG